MARVYSDPSYGSKKTLAIPVTGALNGTLTASTIKAGHTFMNPVTVVDANCSIVSGAIWIDGKLLIGKSAAGTGTFAAIGTVTLTGTKTLGQVVDTSVTSTAFSTGDDLLVHQAAGTETGTGNVQVYVQYTESFVQSDS